MRARSNGLVVGEFFTDGASRLFVRDGVRFHACPYRLVPKHAREYDAVEARIDDSGRVTQITQHWRVDTIKRPRGFAPPPGTKVGRVTSYDGEDGRVGSLPFNRAAVQAIGFGEVEVGEVVEYVVDPSGTRIVRLTGPFGTSVSQVGKKLYRPRDDKA